MHLGRIHYDPAEALVGRTAGHGVANAVRKNEKKQNAQRVRVTNKSDKATVENALDRRTRLVRPLPLKASCFQ